MRSWTRVDGPLDRAAGGDRALPAAALTAIPAAWTLSASGIGERSGAPASGSAGRTGTSVRARLVDDTSVASKAIAPSLPEPSAATNRWWRCSIADCGWSVSIASLSSSGAELGDDVRRHEHERVADRDLAPPDVRLEGAGGQAALAMRVGQGRQARLADQVGLGRPDRRHVHLVAADDRHADPDRAVAVGRLEPEPVGLVGEPLVGRRDRLLEADPDPGRLVVVVLVADRLGDQAGRLEGVARRDPRGHEQVQVALGARDGTDARLDDDERVGRVGESVVLGDDAELHLEPYGHPGLS